LFEVSAGYAAGVTRPWLRWFANAFVVGYAVDAGVSLLEEAVRHATGSPLLVAPRNVLARLVLWSAFWMPVALALTPRLPTLPLLALSLSALWLNFGAAPLALLFDEPATAGPVATALQGAFAASAFLWVRRRNGGRGWLLTTAALAGRDFSLGHTLRCAAGAILVLAPAAIAYLGVLVATSIQLSTHGFVSFDRTGVSLADRRYTRGDREIRLVGMMHVGESEAYHEVARSFVGASTVVLEEGVSDEEALLETPLSYQRAAALLGLEQQDDFERYLAGLEEELANVGPEFLHADLDMSDFSPETLEWLEQAAQVYAAERPWQALRAFAAWSKERAGQWQLVERDLFQRRNEHLLATIEEALGKYERVVVPWGALHLPYIESALVERGFERASSAQHRLLSWRRLLAMAGGGPEAAP
jgi:hypothetical protein